MSKNNPRLGGLFVLLAAVLWGTIPFFSRQLYAQGADPLGAAAARAFIAAVIFLLAALLFKTLRGVRAKDLPFFALYGLCAVTGTYSFYFSAISRLSIAMASMLLYTGPAFVIVLSRILYREPITKEKIVALLLTFAGCFLVVRGYDVRTLTLNLTGIVFRTAVRPVLQFLHAVRAAGADPLFVGGQYHAHVRVRRALFPVHPPAVGYPRQGGFHGAQLSGRRHFGQRRSVFYVSSGYGARHQRLERRSDLFRRAHCRNAHRRLRFRRPAGACCRSSASR